MNSNKEYNITWVLIDELAIGQAPKSLDNLLLLQEKGIKSIFSLCELNEAPNLKEMHELFNYERYALPDHRQNKYPSIDDILYVLKKIKKFMLKGPVYVHCVAAMERSPLICLAWLIKEKGLNIQQSLDYMMQIHKNTNPLAGQLAILRDPKLIEKI